MAEVRRIVIPYTPRRVFQPLHERKTRWACVVAHRRAGKTVACINDLIRRAIQEGKQDGRYAYIAPYYSQAKAIAWDYLKRFAGPLTPKVSETELSVTLPTGAVIRLYGADNPDALRGIYLDGVILDEVGDMRAHVWGEIIRPLLSDRRGWAVFIGTPKGRNHFFSIYEQAQASDDWTALTLRASQTEILPRDELEDAKRSMTKSQYLQEFECQFDVPALGAIYAQEYQQAQDEGRFQRLPYDPAVRVHTFWDLGIGDATAIWFAQVVRSEVRLIDYFEDRGQGLDYYVKVLTSKPYLYGEDWLPHDAQAKQLTSGKSTEEVLRGLNRQVRIAPKLDLESGINAARMLWPRCYFDAERTKRGLECLQNYRRELNEKLGEFRATPVHDWASHGADAFRYLAVSLDRLSGPTKMPKIEYPSLGIA